MKMNKQEKWAKINKRMSAAFLLSNIAYVLIEEAEEEAKAFGGFKHALKLYLKKAKKGMEEYNNLINHEAQRQGKGTDFLKDFEVLDKFVQDFINSDKTLEKSN